MLSSAIFTDHSTLKLVDIGCSFSAAPTSASLAITNGTNGKFTVTSLKGSAVGNATTVTITMSTNAASVALSGTAITIDTHKDGTNAFSDTTASNCKTLLEANTNIAALISVATNTAGIMAAAALASLAGGDDKIVAKSGSVVDIVRTGKGQLTLTLDSDLVNHYGQFVSVVGTTASPTTDVVATVKVIPSTNDNKTLYATMFDYAGAAVDVSAASTVKGFLVGQTIGAGVPGSGI